MVHDFWQMKRRTFLGSTAAGMGAAALGTLLNPHSAHAASESSGVVNPLHFPAKAKRVIFLVMAGGPSHLETFDYKPKLAELDGQPMPESFTAGQPIAQLQGRELKCLAPQHEFAKYGESGQQLSTVFPHIGSVADDLCVIRSLKTEQINHDPAHTFMN
ncbi:MAG: DUF1501 domain-containing protein, partial [Planctomycetaceae bacterium]|nr:DUF1501 domain-containing protein [Planctomycetaceae bacterium]